MFCTCSDDSTRTLPAVQRRRSSSYLRRKNKNKNKSCYNGVVDVLPVGTVGSSVAQVLDWNAGSVSGTFERLVRMARFTWFDKTCTRERKRHQTSLSIPLPTIWKGSESGRIRRKCRIRLPRLLSGEREREALNKPFCDGDWCRRRLKGRQLSKGRRTGQQSNISTAPAALVVILQHQL